MSGRHYRSVYQRLSASSSSKTLPLDCLPGTAFAVTSAFMERLGADLKKLGVGSFFMETLLFTLIKDAGAPTFLINCSHQARSIEEQRRCPEEQPEPRRFPQIGKPFSFFLCPTLNRFQSASNWLCYSTQFGLDVMKP